MERVDPFVAEARCLQHRSEEHTSELQSRLHLVCRLLLEKKTGSFTAEALARVLSWLGNQNELLGRLRLTHVITATPKTAGCTYSIGVTALFIYQQSHGGT